MVNMDMLARAGCDGGRGREMVGELRSWRAWNAVLLSSLYDSVLYCSTVVLSLVGRKQEVRRRRSAC